MVCSPSKRRSAELSIDKTINYKHLASEIDNTTDIIDKSEFKLMAKKTEINDQLKEIGNQLKENSLPENKLSELEKNIARLEIDRARIDKLLEVLSDSKELMCFYKDKKGDMSMAYENQCGSCVYFEMNGDRKGYCSYLRSYYYPGDKTCTHYSKGNSGCYITTIVCDLMGLKDNCGILETLRGFRNNVMQRDPKYKETLYEYDVIGPQIAKNLMEEYAGNKDKEMVVGLFNFFILPTVRLIKEKNYPEAVNRYTQLTESLIDYYGLERVQEVPNDYDYTKGGHGVKKLGTQGGV